MACASEKTILLFVSRFDTMQYQFLNGLCYHFAIILQNRFGGEIWYDPVLNHFVTRIGKNFYDVSGIVSGNFVKWEDFKRIDENETRRIEKFCIKLQ